MITPGFLVKLRRLQKRPRIGRDGDHRQIHGAIKGGDAGLIGLVLAGRDPRPLREDQDVAALGAARLAILQHALQRRGPAAAIDGDMAGLQQEDPEQRR